MNRNVRKLFLTRRGLISAGWACRVRRFPHAARGGRDGSLRRRDGASDLRRRRPRSHSRSRTRCDPVNGRVERAGSDRRERVLPLEPLAATPVPCVRRSQILPRLCARGGDGAGGTPAPSSPVGVAPRQKAAMKEQTRRRWSIRCRRCCAFACWRSPADIRMPKTATRCAAIRCSIWSSAGRRHHCSNR